MARSPSPILALILALVTQSCERRDPPGAAITPSVATAAASSSTLLPAPSPPASSVHVDALPVDSAVPTARDAGPAVNWKNDNKPAEQGAALEASGRALLDAIVHDDVELARSVFFPREPFTPLKDAKDPDRYWVHLFEAYRQDVHKLHRRRRDWSNVTFESFELGSPPKWVAPGEEANKIGYYRTWGARLRYRADGELFTVKVHTFISWQDGWYITHLLPWKKK